MKFEQNTTDNFLTENHSIRNVVVKVFVLTLAMFFYAGTGK